jgi:hypothetical protein
MTGERELIIRLLIRKIGELSPELIDRVSLLSLDRLESLGEALLDFQSLEDLESWFESLEDPASGLGN